MIITTKKLSAYVQQYFSWSLCIWANNHWWHRQTDHHINLMLFTDFEHIYTLPHEIWALFCCAVGCGCKITTLWFMLWFYSFFQAYFNGAGAIIWLRQCQWSNPERYGHNHKYHPKPTKRQAWTYVLWCASAKLFQARLWPKSLAINIPTVKNNTSLITIPNTSPSKLLCLPNHCL